METTNTAFILGHELAVAVRKIRAKLVSPETSWAEKRALQVSLEVAILQIKELHKTLTEELEENEQTFEDVNEDEELDDNYDGPGDAYYENRAGGGEVDFEEWRENQEDRQNLK